MDKQTKEYIEKLTGIIRSTYGFVKAFEGEAGANLLLNEIESTIPEVLPNPCKKTD